MEIANNSPFFVLGSQRSGTTLLRLMLNRHPRIAVPHESKFIMAFKPKLREYGDLSKRENAGRLLEDISRHSAVAAGQLITDRDAILAYDIFDFSGLIDAIMSEKAAAMGKLRWGDKTPYYISHIDEIWSLFPQSKIIHLVRDGRDVAVSQRNMEWMSSNMVRLATDWKWKTTVAHKVGAVRGDEFFLEIRYEDLILESQRVLQLICRFLGEDFASEMLDFASAGADNVPEGSRKWHKSSVRPPDASKIGAWKQKLSVTDRIIFEQNAGSALELFGYEREFRRSTIRSRLKNFYYAAIARW